MNTPRNSFPVASLVVSFRGPTNTLGARYFVSTRRASGYFPQSCNAVSRHDDHYRIAAAQMLARFLKEDRADYGPDSKGWGVLSDYCEGVLPNGDHVFVRAE